MMSTIVNDKGAFTFKSLSITLAREILEND